MNKMFYAVIVAITCTIFISCKKDCSKGSNVGVYERGYEYGQIASYSEDNISCSECMETIDQGAHAILKKYHGCYCEGFNDGKYGRKKRFSETVEENPSSTSDENESGTLIPTYKQEESQEEVQKVPDSEEHNTEEKEEVLFRCTPTGPNVNIRKEPGGNAEVLFQLSKGTYFDVLEQGEQDVLNNKRGRWYRIDFEGKQGYIFSAYANCN